MNTKTPTQKLRCPDCGSEEIREWGDVPAKHYIALDAHGEIDYQDSDIDFDGYVLDGFACAKYCMGRTFPDIDRFIVTD